MIHNFAKKARQHAMFWLGTLVLFVLFLWIFRGILLPFVAGMALAYFLDPVADFLERLGLSRMASTILIVLMFVLVFVFSLAFIVPALVRQTQNFAEHLPAMIAGLQSWAADVKLPWVDKILGDHGQPLQQKLNDWLGQSAGWIATVISQIWTSSLALVNIVSLMVVTPVVAFYMLYDWDKMVAHVDGWLPRRYQSTIRQLAREMDTAIAGFIRGQGTLCIILGSFYAVALSILGVNFGLLIGLFAGLISFIPYVGSLVGLFLSVGVALAQFWPDWIPPVIALAIFVTGQFIEGNILQPKLVGDSVGLHPVWLMFALFAFGSLLGFTGLLIAVPASAAIGVLVRFGLSLYLDSDLYRNTPHEGEDDEDDE